jgi:hypothetical protein
VIYREETLMALRQLTRCDPALLVCTTARLTNVSCCPATKVTHHMHGTVHVQPAFVPIGICVLAQASHTYRWRGNFPWQVDQFSVLWICVSAWAYIRSQLLEHIRLLRLHCCSACWKQWLHVYRICSRILLYLAVLAGLASPAGCLRRLRVCCNKSDGSLAAVTALTALTELTVTATMLYLQLDDWAAVGCLTGLRRLALSTQSGNTRPHESLAAGLASCTLH